MNNKEKGEKAELIHQCLQGCSESWRLLYRQYAGYAFAIARTHPFNFPKEEAEDIAQDTMLALCRKIKKIENIKAFVAQVSHNKCVDKIRKIKETNMSTAFNNPGQEENPDADIPERISDYAVTSQALESLQKLINNLGRPCRDLLTNRFFHELSYKEAGEKLGMPANQVGVYLSRCLGRLRKSIKKQPGLWEEMADLIQ